MFILGFLHLLFLFLSVCNFVAKTTKYLTVKGFWFQLVFLASVFGDVHTYWFQWYQNFFQCSSRPFSGMTRTSLSTCTYCWIQATHTPIFAGEERGTVHFRGQPKSRNLGFRSNVHFRGADVVFRSSIFVDNSDKFVSLCVGVKRGSKHVHFRAQTNSRKLGFDLALLLQEHPPDWI